MTAPIAAAPTAAKPYIKFTAPRREWADAALFMLTLSLVGLKFWPALVLVVVLLIRHWRKDRYAFILDVTILCGGFGFIHQETLPVKLADVAMVVGIGAALLYRKTPMVRNISLMTLAYIVFLFLMAKTSDEAMRTQLIRMRNYLYIVSFFIPLLVFSGKEFDWDKFMHKVLVYALTICGFYVFDHFVLQTIYLLPQSGRMVDTFYNVYRSTYDRPLYPFFAGFMPRHYPYGLYLLALGIVPVATGRIRLSKVQWVIIALALLSSKTMTVTAGLVGCFVLFRGRMKQTLKWFGIAVGVIVALYFIDESMEYPQEDSSTLRISSTINQFTSLEKAVDDEDLALFASGRLAQILPKWELLYDLNRQWLGFGFLHPELTTNPKYQIKNELYIDIAKADEVATEVEVTQVQTILDIGFIGLIVQMAFYIGLYFMIRKLNYSVYYLCVFVAINIFGLGGFAGLIYRDGLLLLGLTLGAVLTANPQCRYSQQPSNNNDSQDNPLLLAER